MTVSNKTIDQLSVDTIRTLSIDAIEKAKSGHPGMPMGAAPMGYELFAKLMKHNPDAPTWVNRDRFVLSAGHGSMLLYSLLHLSGYDLSMDELKKTSANGAAARRVTRKWDIPPVSTQRRVRSDKASGWRSGWRWLRRIWLLFITVINSR